MVWGCYQVFQNPSPKAKLTKDWERFHHFQRHLAIPIPCIASNLPLGLPFQNTPDSGVQSVHLHLFQNNFKFHFEFHYWLVDCAGIWCLISRCFWCLSFLQKLVSALMESWSGKILWPSWVCKDLSVAPPCLASELVFVILLLFVCMWVCVDACRYM